MSDNHDQESELPTASAGQRLKEAREAAGLGTADVAARTRIPERHIVALERGDYAALAARTYAVGFSRLFARAVGLDETEITEMVRAEMAVSSDDGASAPSVSYEPADPSRVADRRLAWIAAVAAFVIVVAGYVFWRQFQVPAMELPSLATEQEAPAPAPAATAAPAPDPQGPVVFTATADGVWVKFYDAQGVQLLQKEMALGETYTVPADAQGPQLWTARPDALSITVGGQPVPPLADRQVTLKDVAVSAQALLARGAPGAQPADAAMPGAAPVQSATQAAYTPQGTRARGTGPHRSPSSYRSPSRTIAGTAAEPAPTTSEAPAPVAESTVSE